MKSRQIRKSSRERENTIYRSLSQS